LACNLATPFASVTSPKLGLRHLTIDDNNKVDDSTIVLIVVVKGQDIPNEVVSP
jgi:hypothetical protein